MSDLAKTVIFAIVGTIFLVGAVVVHFASQPVSIDQFALVGEEFYPDFDSPNDATYLEIAAFDFETRKQRSFRVEYKDGMWRIPSHYDYPAEAADRLARTAASIMGIRREALAGRRATEHKRFGVVDPNSEEAEKVNRNEKDAVGVRVTIGKQTEDVLADYIIGKEVDVRVDLEDEQLREVRGLEATLPLHYVRRPDEDETYVAAISVDASTRFEDWIEPDLLLLDAGALRELVVNDYSFETRYEEVEVVPNSGLFQRMRRLEKVDGEAYTLTKETDFSPWTLEGIDEETEEMESSKISQLTSALDQFEIRGVRPRVKVDGNSIISPELKLEFPESFTTRDQKVRAIEAVALDLEAKGFNLSQNRQDLSFAIASDQGELTAATNEGVVYHLYFGDVVVGDDDGEITVGGGQGDGDVEAGAEANDEPSDTDAGDAGTEAADGVEPAAGPTDDEEDKNRYLLLRVSFDPTYLGEKPTPPVEPTPPAEPDDESTPDMGDDQTMPPTTDDGDNSSDDCAPQQDQDKQDDQDDKSTGDQQSGDTTGNDQSGDSQTGDPQSQQDTSSGDTDAGDAAGQAQDPVAPPVGVPPNQEDVPPPDPQEQYRLAMIQYQAAKSLYEEDLAEYEKKVAAGQSKVDQLNERFADWFYLISAERLDTLRLSRSDLVRPKETEPETPAVDPIQIPGLNDPPTTTPPGSDDGNTTGDDTGN